MPRGTFPLLISICGAVGPTQFQLAHAQLTLTLPQLAQLAQLAHLAQLITQLAQLTHRA